MGAESQEELRRLERERAKARSDKAFTDYHRSQQKHLENKSLGKTTGSGGGCVIALLVALSSLGLFSFIVFGG